MANNEISIRTDTYVWLVTGVQCIKTHIYPGHRPDTIRVTYSTVTSRSLWVCIWCLLRSEASYDKFLLLPCKVCFCTSCPLLVAGVLVRLHTLSTPESQYRELWWLIVRTPDFIRRLGSNPIRPQIVSPCDTVAGVGLVIITSMLFAHCFSAELVTKVLWSMETLSDERWFCLLRLLPCLVGFP